MKLAALVLFLASALGLSDCVKSRPPRKTGVLACQGRQSLRPVRTADTAVCRDSRDGCLPESCGLFTQSLRAAPVTALTFSPSGTELVSNGPRCLIVRSPRDAAEKSRIPCDLPKVTGLAFHGDLLAVAGGTPGESGAVLLFDWKTRAVVHRWSDLPDLATSVAFDATGSRLVVASADGTARVLAINEARELRGIFILRGHAAPVLAAAFVPGGSTIVTLSADRSVKVWSAEDGSLIRTFTQHTEPIHALAIRPTAPDAPISIATVGDDRTLRIWHPEIGRMVRIVRNHEAALFAVAYSREGTAIFTAGRRGHHPPD